jgi:hypothetical protein
LEQEEQEFLLILTHLHKVEILNLELLHLLVQMVEEADLMMEIMVVHQEDRELELLTDHLDHRILLEQVSLVKEIMVEMVIDYNLNLEIEVVVVEKVALERKHQVDLMEFPEVMEELDQILLQHTELNTVKMEFLVAEERDQILVVMALLLEDLEVAETHLLLTLDHQLDLNLE